MIIKHFRSPEQHGHVIVMAAGMHPAFMFRCIGHAGFLRDRQSVHICPERYDSAGSAALDKTNDAGINFIFCIRNAHFIQFCADKGLSFRQIVAQLWNLVKLSSQLYKVIL